MKKFREPADRRQAMLLPPTVDEYVGANDLSRYVDAMVDELDLREIESKYSTQGRPGYQPRILVKLLVYGKLRGISSSRELAQAARENMRFMFLTQNERPDFRTISEFRKRHRQELAELLTQTIVIGIREDLIDLKCVAVDGTKLLGSAGRNSFKKPQLIREDLKKLEAELLESLEKDIKADDDEDSEHGDGDGEVRLSSGAENKKVLQEKLRKALTHFNSMEGEKPKTVSITDPECRFMQGKGINPSYNAQLAVDTKSLMAVGGYVTTACCDSSELIPLVDDIKRRTGKLPQQLLADKGYSNLQALAEVERRQIDAYVSIVDFLSKRSRTGFRYEEAKDQYRCPENRIMRRSQEYPPGKAVRYRSENCSECSQRAACMPGKAPNSLRVISVSLFHDTVNRIRRKMETHSGITMRKIRAASVEPVFGVIKHAMRFRQVTVRGSPMVDSAWKFQLAAYNIFKLAKYFQGNKPLAAN